MQNTTLLNYFVCERQTCRIFYWIIHDFSSRFLSLQKNERKKEWKSLMDQSINNFSFPFIWLCAFYGVWGSCMNISNDFFPGKILMKGKTLI